MPALDDEADSHGDRLRHCAECCNKASLAFIARLWCVAGMHNRTHQDMLTESEGSVVACEHTRALQLAQV